MIKRCVVAAVIVSALFFVTKTGAETTTDFQNFLRDYPSVKVYIEVRNSSGDDKVDINLLKKLLEEAFVGRKSHKFIAAQTAEEADLVLKGDVTEYVWMESDPVDQVWGLESAAIDAAMVENYARIQVQVALIATKHNRTLWSDRVKATMTKRVMPKESSYAIIYPRFIKSIMIEIFKRRTTGTL